MYVKKPDEKLEKATEVVADILWSGPTKESICNEDLTDYIEKYYEIKELIRDYLYTRNFKELRDIPVTHDLYKERNKHPLGWENLIVLLEYFDEECR